MGNGRLLVQPLMRSATVVEVDELAENSTQMNFIDYQDVVKTFFFYRSRPTFRVSIGIGRLYRRGHDTDSLSLKDGIKGVRVLGVVITNQATKAACWLLKLPHELSGLLSQP